MPLLINPHGLRRILFHFVLLGGCDPNNSTIYIGIIHIEYSMLAIALLFILDESKSL